MVPITLILSVTLILPFSDPPDPGIHFYALSNSLICRSSSLS